jgi:hypothetical protein
VGRVSKSIGADPRLVLKLVEKVLSQ